MTDHTDAEVEALVPWLSDLVTFAIGAYAETMVGAREAGDPSDWADGIAREFCEARRPVELAAREAAARAEALREAADVVEEECAADSVTCYCSSAGWLRDRAARIARSGVES